MRTAYCGQLSAADVGRNVKLAGWVNRRRDLGKLTFVDLRDHTGLVQLLFGGDRDDLLDAHTLNREDVLLVEGTIQRRSAGNLNLEMKTGEIEVRVERMSIANRSKTPPFLVEGDGADATEETRLRYRYVDLRRERLQNALRMRHRTFKATRDFFSDRGFVEIETPVLTKSTPEGARDFLVPSRMHRGTFYALPQSPQLFKQLLMVGGVDRYFQLVKCFRDEDLRADRQPEFTQLDLEVSFPSGPEEIYALVEGAVAHIYREVLGVELVAPVPAADPRRGDAPLRNRQAGHAFRHGDPRRLVDRPRVRIPRLRRSRRVGRQRGRDPRQGVRERTRGQPSTNSRPWSSPPAPRASRG